jgi:hypothetical protein
MLNILFNVDENFIVIIVIDILVLKIDIRIRNLFIYLNFFTVIFIAHTLSYKIK